MPDNNIVIVPKMKFHKVIKFILIPLSVIGFWANSFAQQYDIRWHDIELTMPEGFTYKKIDADNIIFFYEGVEGHYLAIRKTDNVLTAKDYSSYLKEKGHKIISASDVVIQNERVTTITFAGKAEGDKYYNTIISFNDKSYAVTYGGTLEIEENFLKLLTSLKFNNHDNALK